MLLTLKIDYNVTKAMYSVCFVVKQTLFGAT